MKNLVIERLRDAVRDAYPPGQTVVRTRDLEWLLNQVDPPKTGPEPGGKDISKCPACGDRLGLGACTFLRCRRSAT